MKFGVALPLAGGVRAGEVLIDAYKAARLAVLGLTWFRVDFGAGTVRLEPGTTKNEDGACSLSPRSRLSFAKPPPTRLADLSDSPDRPKTERLGGWAVDVPRLLSPSRHRNSGFSATRRTIGGRKRWMAARSRWWALPAVRDYAAWRR
jgi:hypothetical protein